MAEAGLVGKRFGAGSRMLMLASSAAFLWFYIVGMALPAGPVPALVKGSAVGLLVVIALIEGRGRDSRLLAAVLVFGAGGDFAIEFVQTAGAAFFLVGHLAAVWLYLRNRREVTSASQKALAIALLVAIPLIAFAMPSDRTMAPLTALYALALAAMAASAWTSRFSRYRVGIGAMLFVASDLLIFARMGPLAQSQLPDMLIWPLYYAGQYLICLGVLRGDQASGNSSDPSAAR